MIFDTLQNEFGDTHKLEIISSETGFIGLLTDVDTDEKIICMFDYNPLKLIGYKNNVNRCAIFKRAVGEKNVW